MNIDDAIKELREMQSQIIHGKNFYGDIADAFEQAVKERDAEIERLRKSMRSAMQTIISHHDYFTAFQQMYGILKAALATDRRKE